jgi:hypothetical protein
MLLIVVAILSIGETRAQSRSDVTDSVDLLAIELFDEIQPRSIHENVEYCGYIGYDKTGKLVATEPWRGAVDNCGTDIFLPGFEAIASYHTHAAYSRDMDSEVPSVDDLKIDFDEGVNGYVATPGGRVWLILNDERYTVQLCGPGCVYADPDFHPCESMIPEDEYTIGTLRVRERRDTGEC